MPSTTVRHKCCLQACTACGWQQVRRNASHVMRAKHHVTSIPSDLKAPADQRTPQRSWCGGHRWCLHTRCLPAHHPSCDTSHLAVILHMDSPSPPSSSSAFAQLAPARRCAAPPRTGPAPGAQLPALQHPPELCRRPVLHAIWSERPRSVSKLGACQGSSSARLAGAAPCQTVCKCKSCTPAAVHCGDCLSS